MNPGFAEWLNTNAGTTVNSYEYNRYGGVSFWNKQNKADVELPEAPGKHLYIKASFWISDQGGDRGEFEISSANKDGSGGTGFGGRRGYGKNWDIYWYGNGSPNTLSKVSCIRYGKMNDILIHITTDTTGAAKMTLTLNGTVIYDKLNWDIGLHGYVKLRSEISDLLLSNIIISDQPIDIKERVVPLNVTAAETDLPVDDDGNYITSEPDKTVIYTLDTSDVIERLGDDFQITGMGFACVPGYSTGDAVTKITGFRIDQQGENELGSVSLSTEKNGKAVLGTTLDMSLADLQNSQFGIKTGA